MKTLDDLIYKNPSLKCLSIIGMEKNCGKTTVLQSLISKDKSFIKAITSIGYDGEEVDQVTLTHKPSIYVTKNSLVATAAGLLSKCDFTRELICFTGFYTPMGEVIIMRALSDGYAQLAGPSITSEMGSVIKTFAELGADKIFIDGAAARKSTAAIEASDACILASGASFSHDISRIVSETVYYTELLNLPLLDCKEIKLKSFFSIADANDCFVYDKNSQIIESFNALDESSADLLAKHLKNEIIAVFSGIVSKLFIQRFLDKVKSLENITLVATDGTRFLINYAQYQDLKRRKASLKVIKKVNLIAVTVNPVSPKGFKLDSQKICSELRAKINIPVFDVLQQ